MKPGLPTPATRASCGGRRRARTCPPAPRASRCLRPLLRGPRHNRPHQALWGGPRTALPCHPQGRLSPQGTPRREVCRRGVRHGGPLEGVSGHTQPPPSGQQSLGTRGGQWVGTERGSCVSRDRSQAGEGQQAPGPGDLGGQDAPLPARGLAHHLGPSGSVTCSDSSPTTCRGGRRDAPGCPRPQTGRCLTPGPARSSANACELGTAAGVTFPQRATHAPGLPAAAGVRAPQAPGRSPLGLRVPMQQRPR